MAERPEHRIDAASLIAVPASSPSAARLQAAMADAENLCASVLNDEALLINVWQTEFGRLGAILIPVVDVSLFTDRRRSLTAAVKGVRLAARLGAGCVSFTGMIPAATGYVRDIADAVDREVAADDTAWVGLKRPGLTTGHAAVVAAFALNIDRLLDFTGRRYTDEAVTFVGLGSIGDGIARLMTRQPPPRRIRLVDVDAKFKQLKQLQEFLEAAPGFDNVPIEAVTVDKGAGVPDHLYGTTSLFLCATSSANVIDIDRLRPGTLVVDDSFPLGFDSRKAVARMEAVADIAITVAGGFQGPEDFTLEWEHDDAVAGKLAEIHHGFKRVANPWPDCMTGCVYSALITLPLGLPQTVGPVVFEDAIDCLARLKGAGFHGTPPYFITFGIERPEPIFPISRSGLAAQVFGNRLS